MASPGIPHRHCTHQAPTSWRPHVPWNTVWETSLEAFKRLLLRTGSLGSCAAAAWKMSQRRGHSQVHAPFPLPACSGQILGH